VSLICCELHDSQLVRYEDGGRLACGECCLDRHCADHADPLRVLISERQREMLANAIGKIPGRERQILSHYYESKITVREIGSIFGVSGTRVCQLHYQALERVRTYCRQEPGDPLRRVRRRTQTRD
jgi:RNA polymerase sigma factor for flagellar operon FliA